MINLALVYFFHDHSDPFLDPCRILPGPFFLEPLNDHSFLGPSRILPSCIPPRNFFPGSLHDPYFLNPYRILPFWISVGSFLLDPSRILQFWIPLGSLLSVSLQDFPRIPKGLFLEPSSIPLGSILNPSRKEAPRIIPGGI